MFPHTVTIFNVIRNKDDSITYHKTIVSDVFYHVEKIISQEGEGEKYMSAYDVVFSSEAIKRWMSKQDFNGEENTYTLRENDIVVLGNFEKNISELIELQKSNSDFFLIKTVSENLYGEDELRNIEVTN